jgi:hypothetical protein
VPYIAYINDRPGIVLEDLQLDESSALQPGMIVWRRSRHSHDLEFYTSCRGFSAAFNSVSRPPFPSISFCALSHSQKSPLLFRYVVSRGIEFGVPEPTFNISECAIDKLYMIFFTSNLLTAASLTWPSSTSQGGKVAQRRRHWNFRGRVLFLTGRRARDSSNRPFGILCCSSKASSRCRSAHHL